MSHRRPLRIALFCAHMHRGGMQRAMSLLSQHLECAAMFVVCFGGDNPEFEFKGRLVDLGVRGELTKSTIARVLAFGRRWWRLRRFIRRERIDVLVSFGEIANLYAILTRPPRAVLSVRVALAEALSEAGPGASMLDLAARRLYRRADAIVAVSQELARELRTDYGVPARLIRVIYNMYDPGWIEAQAAEAIEPDLLEVFASPTIVSVGALVRQKGHDLLIRAVAELPDDLRRATRLVILGEGPERPALETLVATLGLGASVRLIGHRPNPHKYVSRATVWASCSRYEGFPNALVEAMVLGRPVVINDCRTGPDEILGGRECGLLGPKPGSIDESAMVGQFADLLIRLLADPALRARLSAAARERARDFAIGPAVRAWSDVLPVEH